MQRALPLLFFLLLAACVWDGGDIPQTVPPEAPAVDRGVPDDVPLYYEDSDAKKTGYAASATGVTVTMETINGILSPVTYYRKITDAGWTIVQDAQNNGGMLLATKGSRTMDVTFVELPDGAGTKILLRIME